MCPQCGNDIGITSNWIPTGPYEEAARLAPYLRDCGEIGAATDVLTGLASVRIVNFLRRRWACPCGASFDD